MGPPYLSIYFIFRFIVDGFCIGCVEEEGITLWDPRARALIMSELSDYTTLYYNIPFPVKVSLNMLECLCPSLCLSTANVIETGRTHRHRRSFWDMKRKSMFFESTIANFGSLSELNLDHWNLTCPYLPVENLSLKRTCESERTPGTSWRVSVINARSVDAAVQCTERVKDYLVVVAKGFRSSCSVLVERLDFSLDFSLW